MPVCKNFSILQHPSAYFRIFQVTGIMIWTGVQGSEFGRMPGLVWFGEGEIVLDGGEEGGWGMNHRGTKLFSVLQMVFS
jgi:hypothetical protein